MTNTTIDWDDLRYILAVANCGSAVAAAQELGVNASTVQRRISRFETLNGIHLFERRRRGLFPTPECQAIVAEASRIDERVSIMSREILGGDLRLEGLLQVTTTETFLTDTFSDHLAEFCKLYPAIKLQVTLTNSRLSLSRQDADVAIRPSRAPHETLVGQRISGLSFALYGVPSLIGEFPETADIDTIKRLPWIGVGDALSASPTADWIAANIARERLSLTIDTFPAMLTCARVGIGVALLPCSLGDAEPGLCRRELPGPRIETSVWILTHPEIRSAARIKVFMNFMAKALRAERAILEGTATR